MPKKPISPEYQRIARIARSPESAVIKTAYRHNGLPEPRLIPYDDLGECTIEIGITIDEIENLVDDIEENGLSLDAGNYFFAHTGQAARLLQIGPRELFQIYGYDYAEIHRVFMYEEDDGAFMEDDEACAILIDLAVELDQRHKELHGKPRETNITSIYQYFHAKNPYDYKPDLEPDAP